MNSAWFPDYRGECASIGKTTAKYLEAVSDSQLLLLSPLYLMNTTTIPHMDLSMASFSPDLAAAPSLRPALCVLSGLRPFGHILDLQILMEKDLGLRLHDGMTDLVGTVLPDIAFFGVGLTDLLFCNLSPIGFFVCLASRFCSFFLVSLP